MSYKTILFTIKTFYHDGVARRFHKKLFDVAFWEMPSTKQKAAMTDN